MDFPKEEIMEKYVNIYEKYIADYIPDFEVKDGMTRYVRFNDAWRELDPYEKLLICRLLNRKNTFPKKPLQKLPKNSDPQNYVKLKYDSDGNLKVARIGEGGAYDMGFVYVSKQLTIGYFLDHAPGGEIIPSLYNFEWYEYDDADRLISAEIFRGCGSPKDDVIINSEYYEYDGDYQKYLNQMTLNMVRQMMPDRIFNPNQIEYIFERVSDGLDYTSNYYYRKSQTITDKGHISEDTLSHLAENGLRLV